MRAADTADRRRAPSVGGGVDATGVAVAIGTIVAPALAPGEGVPAPIDAVALAVGTGEPFAGADVSLGSGVAPLVGVAMTPGAVVGAPGEIVTPAVGRTGVDDAGVSAGAAPLGPPPQPATTQTTATNVPRETSEWKDERRALIEGSDTNYASRAEVRAFL